MSERHSSQPGDPTRRRLGERNELVMMSSKLVPWLIVLGLLLWPGRDNLVNLIAFRGATEVAGTLTGEEETSFSVNEESVWKYFYSYTADGNSYNGYSYTRKSVSNTPAIQVSRFNPSLSRIEGANYAIMGGLGFWIFALPSLLIALILVFRVRSLLRTRALLIRGEFLDAELVDSTESGKVNDEPRYNLTYKVHLPDGQEEEVKHTFARPGYPATTQVIRNPRTGYMRLAENLEYKPRLERPGQWAGPPKGKYTRSVLWLGGALLFVCWMIIRITLAITGG